MPSLPPVTFSAGGGDADGAALDPDARPAARDHDVAQVGVLARRPRPRSGALDRGPGQRHAVGGLLDHHAPAAAGDPQLVEVDLGAAGVGEHADRLVGRGEVGDHGLVSPATRSPPAPSAGVTMPVIRGACWLTTATPNRPLPVVVMPVIGRSVLSPVTSTPLSPLRSALMPISVVPLSPRSTRPLGRRLGDRQTLQPDPVRPVELDAGAVAQQRGAHHRAGAVDAERTPGRSSGSMAGVPRSLNVASVASIWPLLETTTNGRPGPTASGWPEAGSNELTVTSCTRSLPLPV